jgi:serine/threonine protein kinase/tetratricopeptide (TPR) repeat protein
MNTNAQSVPPSTTTPPPVGQLPVEDTPTIRNWVGNPVVALNAAARPQPGQSAASSAAERLQRAIDLLPVVGQMFAGFELVAVLGRGTFGRVYLARQGELSDRFVALKISTNLTGESRTLARLQHTNIVPIYSVHRVDSFQAVCMPYFGATTLSHLLARYRGRAELPSTGRQLVDTLCLLNDETDVAPPKSAAPAPILSPAALDPGSDPGRETPIRMPALPDRPRSQGFLTLLQGMSYTDAVCWIGAQLADGLAHAHAMGVVHNDLKPANVLLTDAGQPMLLDFGVADDLAHRTLARSIGGTLPYMSPEHIESTRTLVPLTDPRSDIYGLGLVLFEMLTGRHAFSLPASSDEDELPRMLAERRAGPPRIRPHNPAVSPGLEAIIRKCLEPDPAKRYQSAADLRGDLERHRSNRPLQHVRVPSIRERLNKLAWRHPRLSSNVSLALVGLAVIGLLATGLVAREARIDRYQHEAAARVLDDRARDAARGLEGDLKSAQYLLNVRADDPEQIAAGIAHCTTALARFGLPDDEGWDQRPAFQVLSSEEQQRVRDRLTETCVLLARGQALRAPAGADGAAQIEQALRTNKLAERIAGAATPNVVWEQRASLLSREGKTAEAKQAGARAGAVPLRTAADYFLSGSVALTEGRYKDALKLLSRAVELDPGFHRAHMALGACQDRLMKYSDAAASYTTAIALWPDVWWGYYHRGLVRLKLGNAPKAQADFDRAAVLAPLRPEIYIHRAIASQSLKNFPAAIRDLDRALELGASKVQAISLRASVRERSGDKDAAQRDLAEALKLEPTDDIAWVTRGLARLTSDPTGALKDFDAALALNPRSLSGLQNKSHVLSKLGRNDDALKVLNQTLAIYPEYLKALSGRGMMFARTGQWAEAKADAIETLRLDSSPVYQYYVAGIYAQLSRHDAACNGEALRLWIRLHRIG